MNQPSLPTASGFHPNQALSAANLHCLSFDPQAKPLPIGKVFWYVEGQCWAVHADVYPRFMRHDSRSWGIRAPLARFCVEYDIPYLFFWDKKRSQTYCIELTTAQQWGMRGENDHLGGTVNVPAHLWQVIPGKLPGVPWISALKRRYLEPCVEPWSYPSRVASATLMPAPDATLPPEPIPENTQLAFDWQE